MTFIPTCIPDSHPHRVTNTKCHINTIVSPDDGHIVARSMYRKDINILRKIVHQVGFIYNAYALIYFVVYPDFFNQYILT